MDAHSELVRAAAATLRRELPRPLPRWLLSSRFGSDFLMGSGPRAPVDEIALANGAGRMLARIVRIGAEPLLALELDDPAGRLPPSLADALPLLIAGQLSMRGALHLLSGAGLASFRSAPNLALISDWLRLCDEDPLRHLDPGDLGARFPELRRAAASDEWLAARLLLSQSGANPPVIAASRRGPSGATDAELQAMARLGADIVVEGCAAEWVAARHQGLAFLAIALVLDHVEDATICDPGALATRASALLPRLADLLPRLFATLAVPPTESSA